jgi:ketosteroid isomerase-like protein
MELIMKRIAQVPFFFFALNLVLWAQSRPQIAEPRLSKTVLGAVPPIASTESADEDFKTEMQTVVKAWKDSFNNNDMNNLAALYTEDAALIDEDGIIAGRAVLRDAFTKFRASGASMSSITVDRAERSGNIGYLTDSWTEAAPKSGGGTEVVGGYSLIVMKRVGNKWLIAEHAAIAKQK